MGYSLLPEGIRMVNLRPRAHGHGMYRYSVCLSQPISANRVSRCGVVTSVRHTESSPSFERSPASTPISIDGFLDPRLDAGEVLRRGVFVSWNLFLAVRKAPSSALGGSFQPARAAERSSQIQSAFLTPDLSSLHSRSPHLLADVISSQQSVLCRLLT